MTGDRKPHDRAQSVHGVRRAVADLSRRLKVNERQITLHEVTPATWPDTGLGCPEPDLLYAQVVTEGYVLLLACGQDIYEYRTDGGRLLVYVGQK